MKKVKTALTSNIIIIFFPHVSSFLYESSNNVKHEIHNKTDSERDSCIYITYHILANLDFSLDFAWRF